MDNLDVGETVQWGLSINDYLEDFIGKGLPGCRLVAVLNDRENTSLRFGSIVYSAGDYFCDMKCFAETEEPHSMLLLDKDGNVITDIRLENNFIECFEPSLLESDGAVKRLTDRIIAPQSHTCHVVNGADSKVYLYLTDYAGRNLNVPKSQGQYGFDISLFDRLGMSVAVSERSLWSVLRQLISLRRASPCRASARVRTRTEDRPSPAPSEARTQGRTLP